MPKLEERGIVLVSGFVISLIHGIVPRRRSSIEVCR